MGSTPDRNLPGIRWIAGLTLLLGGGCGTAVVTYQCDPACPSGLHCEAGGCITDGAGGDIAMLPQADVLATCSPACSGATPFCDSSLACVACRLDADCPLGQQCQKIGALAQCVDGCADDSRCGAGLKCCGGTCTDTTTDSENCGACAEVCSVPHAAASCAASFCTLGACTEGWADCNHSPADGCETHIFTDPSNCTGCMVACSFAHASAGCGDGCYLRACDFGWDDCDEDPSNGCERPTLTDLANCGGCAVSCGSPSHAVAACAEGACGIASCQDLFGDCDGLFANGCEKALGSDASNCGACGNACANGLICKAGSCTCPNCNFPNAESRCTNFVCVLGKCRPGFANCDGNDKNGCEANLSSDANNCGACGVVCPPMAPACTNAVCGAPVPVCAEAAADFDTAVLTCPGNTVVISIDFASYGTATGMCGNYAIGPCNAVNSVAVVEGICLGMNSCSILAAPNTGFGDPCVGTHKHLYIQATCL